METDRLIALLAAHLTPVDRHVVERRLGCALIVGAFCATLLVSVLYGVRPDISKMLVTPIFWARLALPVGVAAGALILTTRLSRPGAATGAEWAGVAFPIALVWLAGLIVWWLTPADARASLLMSNPWRLCSLNIAFLSMPGFIAALLAVRGLAPTRLRLAGFAAGLMAGATATIAYSLNCPQMGVPFWAVWYVLGMAIPGAAGALLGPRWLRW